MSDARPATPATGIRWSRLLFGVVFLLAVFIVANHLAEGRKIGELLLAVSPLALGVTLVLQSGTYLCVAIMLQRTLRKWEEPRPVSTLLPLALVKQFVSQAVPSIGLSGNLVLIRGLQNRGIPRPLALRTVLVGSLSYYLAFAMMLLVTIVILWWLQDLTRLILSILSLLLVLVSGSAVAVFWIGSRTWEALPVRVHHWLVSHELDEFLTAADETAWTASLLAELTALNLVIFLLDAATLYVLMHAVGGFIEPALAIACLVTATAAASIGLVPGGLGTFEGSCVALLHAHGVGLDSALAGTLLLRGFTFWLPMLPGLFLSHREINR